MQAAQTTRPQGVSGKSDKPVTPNQGGANKGALRGMTYAQGAAHLAPKEGPVQMKGAGGGKGEAQPAFPGAAQSGQAKAVTSEVIAMLYGFGGKYMAGSTAKKAIQQIQVDLPRWLATMTPGEQDQVRGLVSKMIGKLHGLKATGQAYGPQLAETIAFLSGDFAMQRSTTCALQVAHQVTKGQDSAHYIAAMSKALDEVTKADHVMKLPEYTLAKAAGRNLDTTEQGAYKTYAPNAMQVNGEVPVVGDLGKGVSGGEGVKAIGKITGESPAKFKEWQVRQPYASIAKEWVIPHVNGGGLVSIELQKRAGAIGHQVVCFGTKSGPKLYDPNAGGLVPFSELRHVVAKYENVRSVAVYSKAQNPFQGR